VQEIQTTDNWSYLLINSIASLAVAQNMRELYRLVLVDTPLAPYFSECITSEVKSCVEHLFYLLHLCCLVNNNTVLYHFS
jgi:hypothetical protein